MNAKSFRPGTVSMLSLLMVCGVQAQVDPNFHVYIAFGQSNMEGNATAEAQDKVAKDRFKLMPSADCSNPSRKQGTWAPAISPMARCNTALSPVGQFGYTLIDSLPSNIKVGIAIVALGGVGIQGFELDTYQSYFASAASWLQAYANDYGGNPYGRLLATAKEAQKSGVIKGILLHQGESNSGDQSWPGKVKKIYDRLLSDLGLQAKDVPLLVGELVGSDQGGSCAGHNAIIDKLPQTIPTAYVISSKGCPQKGDGFHFTAPGIREMGKRYAQTMLKILKSSTAVTPVSVKASLEKDYVVYDLRGVRAARFQADERSSLENGWNGIRRSLPNGVYWIRSASLESAVKVVNGL